MWAPVPRAELLGELEEILGDIGATDEQIACGLAYAEETLPEYVSIGVGPARGTDGVVAARMNPANAANGTGIDHLEGVLGAVAQVCEIAPPA